MWRRLIWVVSLVSVLGLSAAAARADITKGLLVHYTFDNVDLDGLVVHDVSGNGHDATIVGAGIVTGVPGVFKEAIQFPPAMDQGVELAAGVAPMGNAPRTFSLWFNQVALASQNKIFGYGLHSAGTCVDVAVNSGGIMLYHWGGNVTWGGGSHNFVGADAGFHHLAVRVNDNAKTFADVDMILDGQKLAITAGASTVTINTGNSVFRIGRGENGQGFNGLIDDFYMYNRALTDEEIAQIRKGKAPGQAGNVSPADGATNVPRDAVLNWAPGEFANTHDVYFGTAFADVNQADRNSPLLVSRSQTETTYDPPGSLGFGQMCYWRIDEVNAPPTSTIFKGEVWSFAVEPYAYPLPGTAITATASSMNSADMGPEKTIDGSGLMGDGHSTVAENMWLSGQGAGPAWIQYAFDRVYKLERMLVWNSNQALEPLLGLGAKAVTIEYSADGSTWKTLGDLEIARAPGAANYAAYTTIDLAGTVAQYVKLTIRSNWGGVMPQYGLSEVRFFSVPVLAREPSPASGATGVDVDSSLSWRPGREAAQHKVYVSTDQQAVRDGAVPATTVTTATSTPSLNLAGTYYWRVDEVNAAKTPATWSGDVWSFSTQEYLVVDDFESYTNKDGEAIFQTWSDGLENPAHGGSQVGNDPAPYAESTIVHAGKQSMPLFYNNTTATNSEAVRTFDSPQDWTRYGVKALTLWFYGDPNNAAQQLYVKINSTKILYDGDAADLQRTSWQMWYIDLTGKSVNSVKTLSLGLDRLANAGGTGRLLIDDLRLYSHARSQVAPVAPEAAGLQAQYAFDGDAKDSSGKGRNGAAQGGATFAAGKIGQALSLDGVDDVVTIPGYKGILAAVGVQHAFTVCAWIKTAVTGMDIIAWGTDASGQRMNFRVDTVLRMEHAGGNMRGTNGPSLLDNRWHHVAATVPEAGTMMDVKLYVDGRDASAPGSSMTAFNLTANVDVAIGSGGPVTGRFFKGLIDDVRIYDRVLSAGEIAGMAGLTIPYDRSF